MDGVYVTKEGMDEGMAKFLATTSATLESEQRKDNSHTLDDDANSDASSFYSLGESDEDENEESISCLLSEIDSGLRRCGEWNNVNMHSNGRQYAYHCDNRN